MNNPDSKEKILNRIREGLKTANLRTFDKPTLTNREIFVPADKPLVNIFEEELTNISGLFFYCHTEDELIEKLKEIHQEKKLNLCYSPEKKFGEISKKAGIEFTTQFERAEEITSGISSCEFLVARYGSVMVSSAQAGARKIFSFPEIHIVIAYENQLVLEIEEALDGIQKKYGDDFPSQITNITGPSRTADIEKTLILGAHGPKQLIVFVVKS